MSTSRVEIDLRAIDRNLAIVREVLEAGAAAKGDAGAPPINVCAVLKQDAYGLGASRIAKRLSAPMQSGANQAGVDLIATYTLDEARVIAEASPRTPILVLMPVCGLDRTDPLYRCAAEGRLHLVVHDLEQMRAINEIVSKLGVSLPVHVQLDTGLTRGGESHAGAMKVVEAIVNSPRLLLTGIMTHFASPCSDAEFTSEQMMRFSRFMDDLSPLLRAAVVAGHHPPTARHMREPGFGSGGLAELSLHLANSCATFRSRLYHGTMVRIGQCLYGFAIEDADRMNSDGGYEFAAHARRLEPAVRWTSSVVHVQEIPPGWTVGYGSTWRAPKRIDQKNSRIAIVPVGYADGYPRTLGGASEKRGGGPGWVGFTGRVYERSGSGEILAGVGGDGQGVVYAPVVGRVSMDQITVDVTDVPARYLSPGPGLMGEVEIFSRDKTAPNYPPTLAAAANTITHELLCRVSPRVERVYRYPAVVPSPVVTPGHEAAVNNK